MKKLLITALALGLIYTGAANAGIVAVQPSKSSPTFMIGIAVEFGDSVNKADVGLTAKVVSTNRPDEFIVGAGVSYFPWAAKDPVGVDLSAGYNFDNVAAMAGYDILRWKPQLSVGYVPTESACNSGYNYSGGNCVPVAPPPPPVISDSRLKRDIKLVAVRDDGLKFYSFKYLWSDETYVGVMAQDLLQDPRWADAVVVKDNGFYAVNYQGLGIRMTTLERWQNDGPSSVLVASGYNVRIVKRAA